MADTSPTPLIRDDQIPRGFSFAAVRAGLKASGNPDLACAVADQPAAAAAMFTSNKVIAAPLIVGQRHLQRSQNRLRVALVNAGNANCATGEAGISAAQQCCASAGALFGCEPHFVLPSSTGIIGVPLPVQKLTGALPALHAALGSSAAHLEQMAGAIMTTDTRPKVAAADFEVEGVTVRVAGIAKGAGMIHPQLQSAPGTALHATMLVYLFTDAELETAVAADLLHHAVDSASPSMVTPPPTTPFCYSPAEPAESSSEATTTTRHALSPTSERPPSPRHWGRSACRWPSRSWRTEKAFNT
jgi:glutamate N-acetyltransferase/amino-acid N-acetyltransferase